MKAKLRIGVVGYCPPTKFNETKAKEMISEAYDRLDCANPYRNKIIVSGLTNVGILKLSYEEAQRRNWKTAGIACKKAYDFKDNWFPVDEEPIIVGENWGDESPTFLDSIEVLVRVGGGKQSLSEIAEMKSRGKQVIEYNLPAENN